MPEVTLSWLCPTISTITRRSMLNRSGVSGASGLTGAIHAFGCEERCAAVPQRVRVQLPQLVPLAQRDQATVQVARPDRRAGASREDES